MAGKRPNTTRKVVPVLPPSRSERLVCCSCGHPLGKWTVSYRLDAHEVISQAEAHGHLITLDAAVTCSTNCLVTYLTTELEAVGDH